MAREKTGLRTVWVALALILLVLLAFWIITQVR